MIVRPVFIDPYAYNNKDVGFDGITAGSGATGVTVMVLVIGEVVVLVPTNEAMSPVPEAAKPIAVFELVQL